MRVEMTDAGMYVYLADGPIVAARTIDVGHGVCVDIDAAGRPVGVEVLETRHELLRSA